MGFQTPVLHAESPIVVQKGLSLLVEGSGEMTGKDGLLTMAGACFSFLSYLSTERTTL